MNWQERMREHESSRAQARKTDAQAAKSEGERERVRLINGVFQKASDELFPLLDRLGTRQKLLEINRDIWGGVGRVDSTVSILASYSSFRDGGREEIRHIESKTIATELDKTDLETLKTGTVVAIQRLSFSYETGLFEEYKTPRRGSTWDGDDWTTAKRLVGRTVASTFLNVGVYENTPYDRVLHLRRYSLYTYNNTTGGRGRGIPDYSQEALDFALLANCFSWRDGHALPHELKAAAEREIRMYQSFLQK